jgi:hypothetical protein
MATDVEIAVELLPKLHDAKTPEEAAKLVLDALARARQDAIAAALVKREELRKACAEIVQGGEDWPDHGNVELAIAASMQLLVRQSQRYHWVFENCRVIYHFPGGLEYPIEHTMAARKDMREQLEVVMDQAIGTT